jgi:hypothetical protein
LEIIIGIIGGFLVGWRAGAKAVMPTLSQVANAQAIDRANYLRTLRRELANILIWRDPGRYLQLYKELNSEVTSLASWRPEEVRKQPTELRAKHPISHSFYRSDSSFQLEQPLQPLQAVLKEVKLAR